MSEIKAGDRVRIVAGMYIGETATVTATATGDSLGRAVRENGDAWLFLDDSIEKIEVAFRVGDRVVLTDDDVSYLPAGTEGQITDVPGGRNGRYFEVLFDGTLPGSDMLLAADEIELIVEEDDQPDGPTDLEIAKRLDAAATLAESKGLDGLGATLSVLLYAFAFEGGGYREVVRKMVAG